MARVLGAPYDPATRIENRIGEPSANPYLYIAAQIVSGLDGIANKQRAGAAGAEPVQLELSAAAEDRCPMRWRRWKARALFREQFGETFIHYFTRLQAHRTRPLREVEERARRRLGIPPDEPTEWEQNEYFDFF